MLGIQFVLALAEGGPSQIRSSQTNETDGRQRGEGRGTKRGKRPAAEAGTQLPQEFSGNITESKNEDNSQRGKCKSTRPFNNFRLLPPPPLSPLSPHSHPLPPRRCHLTSPSASTLTSRAFRVPFANQLTAFLPGESVAGRGGGGMLSVCLSVSLSISVCVREGRCKESLLRLCLMLVKTTLPAIIKINHNILRPLSSATEIDTGTGCANPCTVGKYASTGS